MKTVILAGGFGTRISEETSLRPKPMVEVGGRPLLWHIMKLYSHHGLKDFIICLGYKGYFIKEYFANYFLHNSDVTFHLAEDRMEVHNTFSEDSDFLHTSDGISDRFTAFSGFPIAAAFFISSHVGGPVSTSHSFSYLDLSAEAETDSDYDRYKSKWSKHKS